MAKYVMALDAGTTSNRCILFNEQGEICSMAQKEFRQFFPNPGWVLEPLGCSRGIPEVEVTILFAGERQLLFLFSTCC